MNEARTLGRFRLLSTLGRGGMGTVYLADDPLIGRQVAIKEILVDTSAGAAELDEQYQRFAHEFRSAGSLSHSNIVTIYDVGQADESYFIAMERVSGESLASLLRRQPQPSHACVISVAQQVAAGLDHAHRCGVLHRDVKPANILVTPEGLVKLTDFGIAKLLGADRSQPATVVGTPGYMSPELVRGRALDGRSDQFALAILLYQMLVGTPPYRGESMSEVIYQLLHQLPAAPSRCDSRLSAALDAALLKGLAQDPAARYPSCRALAAAVTEALSKAAAQGAGGAGLTDTELSAHTRPVIAGVAARVRPRRGRWLLVTAALASAVLAAALFAMLPRLPGRQSPITPAASQPAASQPAAQVEAPPRPKAAPPPPALAPRPADDLGPSLALRITSEPPGAALSLDGRDTGRRTPAEMVFEPGRSYALALSLEGHAGAGWRFSLDQLSPQQRQRKQLHFPLAPSGPRGTLAVTADYPVRVRVGDRSYPAARRHEILLPTGSLDVKLLAPQVFLSRSLPLILRADQRSLVRAPAAYRVRIAAQPSNCRVSIDGRELDDTPPLALRLVAGNHTVLFRWADGRRQRKRVAVARNGQRIFGTAR